VTFRLPVFPDAKVGELSLILATMFLIPEAFFSVVECSKSDGTDQERGKRHGNWNDETEGFWLKKSVAGRNRPDFCIDL
jgi:hypothetical protein